MCKEANHKCRYIHILETGDWRRIDNILQRNLIRIPRCQVCGKQRPTHRTRIATFVEEMCAEPLAAPRHRPMASKVAKEIFQRGKEYPLKKIRPVKGLYGILARKDMTQTEIEEDVEALMLAGWLLLRWKIDGSRRILKGIAIVDTIGLREFVEPGLEARRFNAIIKGLKELAVLNNIVANDVITILKKEIASTLSPEFIQALVAIAKHTETGEILAERVFSVRYLGDSKALNRFRTRLETLIGPLTDICIRETTGLTYIGGKGHLEIQNQVIYLEKLEPFMALSRNVILNLKSMSLPKNGLFLVENLTVFEACCNGEVIDATDTLIIWTAGMPGRAIRSIVERTTTAGARIQVWADLDLSGVRIYRLIYKWSNGTAEAYRMNPNEINNTIYRPLNKAEAARIKTDLERFPKAPLADTLHRILDSGVWIEQESQL